MLLEWGSDMEKHLNMIPHHQSEVEQSSQNCVLGFYWSCSLVFRHPAERSYCQVRVGAHTEFSCVFFHIILITKMPRPTWHAKSQDLLDVYHWERQSHFPIVQFYCSGECVNKGAKGAGLIVTLFSPWIGLLVKGWSVRRDACHWPSLQSHSSMGLPHPQVIQWHSRYRWRSPDYVGLWSARVAKQTWHFLCKT